MENYIDNALASEQAFGKIQLSHEEKALHELEDLQEIQQKMLEQKKNLDTKNTDGRYDEILENLSQNIEQIGKIITGEQQAYGMCKKSPNLGKNDKYYQVQMALSNDPLSPYRGKMEMENINTYRNNRNGANIPFSPNMSNGLAPRETFDTTYSINPNDTATSPTDQERERVSRKRNSPMPSNIISNIIAKFNLNKKKSSQSTYHDNKMRFHNVSILHHSCGRMPCEVGCQADLMRLLFLFLATRPYSRHREFICSLAMSQFEVTLELLRT